MLLYINTLAIPAAIYPIDCGNSQQWLIWLRYCYCQVCGTVSSTLVVLLLLAIPITTLASTRTTSIKSYAHGRRVQDHESNGHGMLCHINISNRQTNDYNTRVLRTRFLRSYCNQTEKMKRWQFLVVVSPIFIYLFITVAGDKVITRTILQNRQWTTNII
jgi:hypothetical protein